MCVQCVINVHSNLGGLGLKYYYCYFCKVSENFILNFCYFDNDFCYLKASVQTNLVSTIVYFNPKLPLFLYNISKPGIIPDTHGKQSY